MSHTNYQTALLFLYSTIRTIFRGIPKWLLAIQILVTCATEVFNFVKETVI